ncbi:MAG: hypothetical protein ACXAEF_00075 [Candidatus Thorarchaeota archaeon]
MEDDNPLSRLRKAAHKKLDDIQESEIIQEITNAIGDRRIRDLIDIIAREESTKSWSAVVDYLIKSEKRKYPVPVGYDALEIKIEPLKFREVIFEIFSCSGWEPIDMTTDKLLEKTYNAESSIDAGRIFANEITSLVEVQIEKADTLFFNPSEYYHIIPIITVDALLEAQNRAIKNVRITKQDKSIFVSNLWNTEHGRQALSSLGIAERTISEDEYEMVISVLQVSSLIKENIHPIQHGTNDTLDTFTNPSNQLYKHLLESIISHNTKNLENLGSRHSFPVLNYTMRNSIDQYKTSNDSEIFRALLASIRSHVAVRNQESILLLNEVALEKDSRLITPCIMALGNFYDTSAINALVNIICSNNSSEARMLCIKSIENIRQRCPETQIIVKNALTQDCRYLAELRRYYRETWKN